MLIADYTFIDIPWSAKPLWLAFTSVLPERGKGLLDRGVITQEEFDVLKANALA